MKICGIISEFNPFTNGHEYIINQVKEKYGLDCLCLMSGNFVQRGEMAILDKYSRATCAINAGADVVVELPLAFSLSSAEYFAYGAVKILNSIGVSHIAFGVKIKSPEILFKFAKIRANEPTELKNLIKSYTKTGMDYNKSMQSAYKAILPSIKNEIDEIFNEPNNILALEYLSAIIKLKSNIQPIFIQRQDCGYNHDKPIKIDKKYFLSATAVRNLLNFGKIKKIKKYIPTFSFTHLKNINQKNIEKNKEKLDTLIITKIRELDCDKLENINDINTSLSHLIVNNCKMYSSTKDLIEASNTKNFKESRIRRLLINAYFDITKEKYKTLFKENLPINVLAVSKSKKNLLSQLIKNSKIKLIVSEKDKESLSENERLIIDIAQRSTTIYDVCNSNKFSSDKTIFV